LIPKDLEPADKSTNLRLSRRDCMALLAFTPALQLQTPSDQDTADAKDWSCPMDPDVHLDRPGKCPRCGMTLVLKVPDRLEYPLHLTVQPRSLRPGQAATFLFRVFDPAGTPVLHFETVHEKLIHLFIVSQDLEFFAHVHPAPQDDGSFLLTLQLPKAGIYRLLADYYPSGSVPQLTAQTLYVKGTSRAPSLEVSFTPERGQNLVASLRLEPEQLMAGLQSRLFYSLNPSEGLERYLGAWGHMLVVSEDLIDLMHLHPFLAGNSTIQYNVIFPRAGKYKVWSQFQRLGVVNTIAFSVQVNEV
jgi:hypothetical protein